MKPFREFQEVLLDVEEVVAVGPVASRVDTSCWQFQVCMRGGHVFEFWDTTHEKTVALRKTFISKL